MGDDISLTANGSISAGYNGSYGNQIESDHGLGFGGAGALNGYFYNPNFLSFNINPYFNQSRSNSDIGSISNASGVALNTSIFGGSHFPGSVNYAANFNSTGNYGIPGITSLNTNGNNQTFGINWGVLLPNLPTLSVGYQQGDSNYYLYGTNESGNSDFRSFNLSSNYNLLGFGLTAGVAHGTSESLIPGVVLDGQSAIANSDTTNFTGAVSHPLPWNGSFNTSFNRTDLNSDYLGYRFNGDIDLVTSSIAFHPTPKLTLSLGGDYTDNFSGSLYQAIIGGASGSSLLSTTAGTSTVANQSASTTTGEGIAGLQESQQASHAYDLIFNTTYSFATNLQADGEFERREQSYFGESFGSNLYSAGVVYTRQIAGGHLGSSVNVVDSTTDGSGQNELGFNANANFTRRIGLWQVSGYMGYAQNVETFLISYNTSFYNFGANMSRRFGGWYWSASAGAGRSGLTDQPGTSNSSESFGTTLSRRTFGFGANYAKSDGNSLASGSGLVSTPLPPIIPSNLLVLYGGTSYSFSATAAPKRGFNAALSYVKSKSNFDNVGVTSWNNYEQENAYLQYQFRQLGLNGGYTRFVQGFSASGSPPANFSSFYIGVYRWFNFF